MYIHDVYTLLLPFSLQYNFLKRGKGRDKGTENMYMIVNDEVKTF